MSSISAKQALELWQQAGLIDAGKAAELNVFLSHQPQGSSRVIAVFSVIGAVLAGLGMVLFVASHWDGMSPLFRIAVLFATYVVLVLSALLAQRSGNLVVATALWLVVTLMVGANIFLIGQLFNFSLTFWQGPLLWMFAALVMAWATRSALQVWLAVPLGLLALGWFGGGEGWFSDDQLDFLISPGGLRPLLPVLGLCLVSLGLLARRLDNWRFAASTLMAWGVLLGMVPMVLASFDDELFRWVFEMQATTQQWTIVAVSVGLMVAALLFGDFHASHNGLALVYVALLIYLMLVVAAFNLRDQFESLPMYIGFVISVFVATLAVVRAGATSGEPAMVNIGIVGAAVLILGQYFSWSLELLDRALAFVIGGMLLIAIAWWGEHQRRRLMREMSS